MEIVKTDKFRSKDKNISGDYDMVRVVIDMSLAEYRYLNNQTNSTTECLDFIEYVLVRLSTDQKDALLLGEKILKKYGRY